LREVSSTARRLAERFGDLQAEAARAAGDERGLAGEVEQLRDGVLMGASGCGWRRGLWGASVSLSRVDRRARTPIKATPSTMATALPPMIASTGSGELTAQREAKGERQQAAVDQRPNQDVEPPRAELHSRTWRSPSAVTTCRVDRPARRRNHRRADCYNLQNQASSIVRQVSSRRSTTPSQASTRGSS
jgi:hypothetical protein